MVDIATVLSIRVGVGLVLLLYGIDKLIYVFDNKDNFRSNKESKKATLYFSLIFGAMMTVFGFFFLSFGS